MKTKQIIAEVIVFGTIIVIGIAFLRMNREDTPKNNGIAPTKEVIIIDDETQPIDDYETLVEKAEKHLPEIGDSMEEVEKLLGEPDDWEKKDSNEDVVSFTYRNYKGTFYKFWFANNELYHIKTGKGW